MEIAVHGNARVPQFKQHLKQRSAVSTSAHTHNNVCSVLQQRVAADELTDSVYKLSFHLSAKIQKTFWGISIGNHGRPWACEREGPATKWWEG